MWPKQAGGKERKNSPRFSRVATVVGDTAVTGRVGAHMDDSDYPLGKYVVYSWNSQQMYSLCGAYNSLFTAQQGKGSKIKVNKKDNKDFD